MYRRGLFVGFGILALAVASAACSSSGGTATVISTPAPSGVVLGTLGNATCTAPNNLVPGTYAQIQANGSITNNAFMQRIPLAYNGYYFTYAYSAAGPTPAPTNTPIVIASEPPSTPGAILSIVYYGEYVLPATDGLTTAATNGCFMLITGQTPTGSPLSTGRAPQADPSPSPFTGFARGAPAFAAPYPSQSSVVLEGTLTDFTIDNITRTSGAGTFTLGTASIGNVLSVTGTVAITGSTAFYADPSSLLSTAKSRLPQSARRQ